MAQDPEESHDSSEPDIDELPDLGVPAAGHVSVLPDDILRLLAPVAGETFLDCTLGRAGHASLIAPLLGPTGRYIGLDVDPANIAFSREKLAGVACRVDLVRANFASASAVLASLGVPKVDMILADLGFASNQMDNPERGFSFRFDGPLDMRLDPDLPLTASDIVNTWPERELADLIYKYGEERLSRKIARKIVEERGRSPMKTTVSLADVVRRAYGPAAGRSKINPATRTFMALRIAVNEELGALERLLEEIPMLLAKDGRAGIISFHSLEDRPVKRAFLGFQQAQLATRLTHKPVIASDAERDSNPRSRSAKLRVIKWTPPQKYKKER